MQRPPPHLHHTAHLHVSVSRSSVAPIDLCTRGTNTKGISSGDNEITAAGEGEAGPQEGEGPVTFQQINCASGMREVAPLSEVIIFYLRSVSNVPQRCRGIMGKAGRPPPTCVFSTSLEVVSGPVWSRSAVTIQLHDKWHAVQRPCQL